MLIRTLILICCEFVCRFVHLNEHPYSCKKSGCDMTFKSKRDLNVHLKNAHDPGSNKHDVVSHSCPYCDKDLKSKAALRQHVKQLHKETEAAEFGNGSDRNRTLECVECDKAFKKPRERTEHVKLVHKADAAHPCPECGKVLTTRSILHSHIRSMHSGQRPWACSECPLRFKRKGNLDEHERNIHAPYHSLPCPVLNCHALLANTDALMGHLKQSHSGDKTADATSSSISNVAAELPSKRGNLKKNSSNRGRNRKSSAHHPETSVSIENHSGDPLSTTPTTEPCSEDVTGGKPLRSSDDDARPSEAFSLSLLSCPFCQQQCGSVDVYSTHVRSAHEEEMKRVVQEAKKNKYVICHICGESLRSLEQHIRNVHSNSRPHQCSECKSVFSCLSLLAYWVFSFCSFFMDKVM